MIGIDIRVNIDRFKCYKVMGKIIIGNVTMGITLKKKKIVK